MGKCKLLNIINKINQLFFFVHFMEKSVPLNDIQAFSYLDKCIYSPV